MAAPRGIGQHVDERVAHAVAVAACEVEPYQHVAGDVVICELCEAPLSSRLDLNGQDPCKVRIDEQVGRSTAIPSRASYVEEARSKVCHHRLAESRRSGRKLDVNRSRAPSPRCPNPDSRWLSRHGAASYADRVTRARHVYSPHEAST